jgi:hypothetical protein
MQTRASLDSLLSIAGALLVALCADAPKAHACSTQLEGPDFGWGVPADNATDVPTDVILYYPISPGQATDGEDVPGTFTLTTLDGGEVALTARRAHVWGYELVPAEALAPNTAYALTGSWMVGSDTATKTLRFTTGAGPLAGAPATPDALIEHYQLTMTILSSCDPPPSGSCLSFGDPDLLVEHTYIDGFGQLHDTYLTRGSSMTNLSGIEQGTPFECVRLRTRAMNGTYSEPQMLCREDGALAQLTSPDLGCTPEGLTSAGMPVDLDVANAGEAQTADPADDDTARPANGGAGAGGAPNDESAADDASEMTEQDPTPSASSHSGSSSNSGCSAVRAAAPDAPGAWTLCIGLTALFFVRRGASARRS